MKQQSEIKVEETELTEHKQSEMSGLMDDSKHAMINDGNRHFAIRAI